MLSQAFGLIDLSALVSRLATGNLHLLDWPVSHCGSYSQALTDYISGALEQTVVELDDRGFHYSLTQSLLLYKTILANNFLQKRNGFCEISKCSNVTLVNIL